MGQEELFDEKVFIPAFAAARILHIKVESLRIYHKQRRAPQLRTKRIRGRTHYFMEDVNLAARKKFGLGPDGKRTHLSTEQAAEWLGKSPAVLRVERSRGKMTPTWERDGKRVWYLADSVADCCAQSAGGACPCDGRRPPRGLQCRHMRQAA